MERSDFRFFESLRVRWSEVDVQRIVFNAHYLTYFDVAVAGYWRALALPYAQTLAALDGDLFVRKASVDYESPARYDDWLDIGLRCGRVGRSSLRLDAAVFRGGQRLVQGELVYVFADAQASASRELPASLSQLMLDHDRGEAVLDVTIADWKTLGEPIRTLRHAVFVDELGAAASVVDDAQDPGAIHGLARNRYGVPVCCGRIDRLVADDGGSAPIGRIGRLATRADLRRAGHGAALLRQLLAAAEQRGLGHVRLHVNPAAVALYQRAGFVLSGRQVEDGGVMHCEMQRAL